MTKFYPEEISEIVEAISMNEEIYSEFYDDLKKENKYRKYPSTSKLNPKEYERMIEYYFNKIEMCRRITEKIGHKDLRE